jgi:membrane-bound lytic murein transglycosylase B
MKNSKIMEKIIIEVDQLTAAKWDSVSPIKKKEISKKISQLLKVSLKKDEVDFWAFVDEIRQEAQANGITEKELEKILNE